MPQFSDDLFLGSAVTYQGSDSYPAVATFTGSITTTVLTVTAMLSGDPITVGMFIDSSTSLTNGTYITALGTGSGGTGTYTMNKATTTTLTGTAITSTGVYYAGGGGGWTRSTGTTLGGLGGGAGGVTGTNTAPGGTNQGGGGGGGGSLAVGGTGGSGILIIAYPNTNPNLSSVSAGLTCNGSAGNITPNTTYRTGYKVYRFTAGTGTISW